MENGNIHCKKGASGEITVRICGGICNKIGTWNLLKPPGFPGFSSFRRFLPSSTNYK